MRTNQKYEPDSFKSLNVKNAIGTPNIYSSSSFGRIKPMGRRLFMVVLCDLEAWGLALLILSLLPFHKVQILALAFFYL